MMSEIRVTPLYTLFLLFRSCYPCYPVTSILEDSVFLVTPPCKMGVTPVTFGVIE